jgi:hypothetical protein
MLKVVDELCSRCILGTADCVALTEDDVQHCIIY